MKVSEEIQARANKMSALAEAIRRIEEMEMNGRGRRLILLLMVTYSGLSMKQCGIFSGYSYAGTRRAVNLARDLIEKDWECQVVWDESVKIIHKNSVKKS